MSQFSTSLALVTAQTKGLKAFVAAAVVGGALVAAASANASPVFLRTAEMYTPGTAYITGGAGSGYPTVYAYSAPVEFTANNGTGAIGTPFTFLGFCIDIFDEINVGINSPLAINLQYDSGPLDNNSAHSPWGSSLVTFNTTQKNQISALVNYGSNLWNAAPNHAAMSTALISELAGVQGAIWQVANPTYSVTGAPVVNGWGDQAQIGNFITAYSNVSFLNTHAVGNINVVYDRVDPMHQAFAFAVPEPTTWLMMIMGFGGIGAMMRRRRAVVAFA